MTGFFVAIYLAVGAVLAWYSDRLHSKEIKEMNESHKDMGQGVALFVTLFSGVIYAILFPLFIPHEIKYLLTHRKAPSYPKKGMKVR
jgi:hypothetical protein